MEFVTPSFGLAPVVARMAPFLEQHRASLAEAHEQARKLGQGFTLNEKV